MHPNTIITLLTIFSLFLVCPSTGWPAKPKLIDLGRGHYEILTTKPKGKKPHPLLVIVPAKQDTMTGSLFEDLAHAAAAQGYRVVRFNWGFVTNSDEPSKDLSTEANDLKTVTNYFAKQKDIDPGHVSFIAKSFGSKVVMKKAFKMAKGLVLLTPNCSKKESFTQTYGKLTKEKIPTHIVISKDDPHCDVNQIHKAMGGFKKKYVTLHTLFGDHNFATIKDEKRDLNRKVAVDSVINWLMQKK